MRMLQNYNAKSYLLLPALVLITACVSQNPPIEGKPVNAEVDSTMPAKDVVANNGDAPAAPQAASTAAPADGAAGSQQLSTTTVAPVGFEKFLGIFTPYRITIQQGNFVSKEMADQVKVGMTREQVRFLLGTALITDMFHADRWDYIFRLLKPSGELTTSRVTVFFEKSLVAKIERGELPNEQEYLKRITDAAITNGIEHVDRPSDKPKPKKDE